MPEMLAWCGRTFRVEHRVERTCVDVLPPEPGNRRFPANDVVVLDGPRCDGSAHDGCMRGCKVFWNETWLEPADAASTEANGDDDADAALLQLRTKVDE